MAGYADTDGDPSNGCETSIQCLIKTSTPGSCSVFTHVENVDKFWIIPVSYPMSTDPYGAMTTNSNAIAFLYNQQPSQYPFFTGPDHIHYSSSGGPAGGGEATVQGAVGSPPVTILFGFDGWRGSAACMSNPTLAALNVVCSGSATLGP